MIRRLSLLIQFGIVVCLGSGTVCRAGELAQHFLTDKWTYHNDRQRSGWNRHEHVLTPASISKGNLILVWESPRLDSHQEEAPRLFASPLFVSRVSVTAPPYEGEILPVAFVASGTGYVYAISAGARGPAPPGTVLWQRRLSEQPCRNGRMSILGTPVIDLAGKRLYVVSCDTNRLYRAYALDLGSGRVISGWPVGIGPATVNKPGVSRNGSTRFPQNTLMNQRGALNLSHDGSRLYVPFGKDSVSGWLVAIDTESASVHSAFSTTARTEEAQGGMWASGGASIDAQGRIHIATGASVTVKEQGLGVSGIFPDSDNNWGQSIIQLSDNDDAGFELIGTYTPFDYCRTQAADIDLGSSGTIVVNLPANQTATPRLLALVGGKQGSAYLLNRDDMPGSLMRRQPCSNDSATDRSLLAPDPQPQFGKVGPLSAFGPYSVDIGWYDFAKSRTTAAYFVAADGSTYIYATGNTKEAEDSTVSIPPSLVRLKIVTAPSAAAYLTIDRVNGLVFQNPSSPVISSNGSKDAVIWVVDMNAQRTTSLWDDNPPKPVLYAMDALTLDVLWRSEEGDLHTSGKYSEPTVVNGMVLVGTDRLQAFGLAQ